VQSGDSEGAELFAEGGGVQGLPSAAAGEQRCPGTAAITKSQNALASDICRLVTHVYRGASRRDRLIIHAA
jgi:hypothetical protein